MAITEADLDAWFTHHVTSPYDVDRYKAIWAHAEALARVILSVTPPSADQTAALRKVREAMWTANSAIACDRDSKAVFSKDADPG